jgi:hypothetical protein
MLPSACAWPFMHPYVPLQQCPCHGAGMRGIHALFVVVWPGVVSGKASFAVDICALIFSKPAGISPSNMGLRREGPATSSEREEDEVWRQASALVRGRSQMQRQACWPNFFSPSDQVAWCAFAHRFPYASFAYRFACVLSIARSVFIAASKGLGLSHLS